MKLNKEDRKLLVQCFKKAKANLWDGHGIRDKQEFICWAIDNSGAPEHINTLAQQIIMDRIDGDATLWGWLYSQGVDAMALTDVRVQAHRRAWLNKLIKEFSE